VGLTNATRGKVLVFGQDSGSFPDRVLPNLRVIRIAQSDVDDVVSLMAGRREQNLEAGRKLRVD
jgi:hypothetical protein